MATELKQRRMKPALTPEAREQQMIALAVDCAEEQLRSGKASSQVITHYLKRGSAIAELEREKLENENLLLKAKVEAIKSEARTAELFENAIKAMKCYSGNGSIDDEEDDPYDDEYDEYD